MAGIIGHLLPLAVGVALSSVPIVVMVLILLSPRGRWASLSYLVGTVVGLSALTVGFTAAASLLPPLPASKESPEVAAIEIVLGVALLALAVVRFVRARHRNRVRAARVVGGMRAADTAAGPDPALSILDDDVSHGPPVWMTRLTGLGPVPSFGVGFVLMLRPKNLLLTIAAGVAIATGGVSVGEMAVAVAVYVVLGLSTLAAPIIFTLLDPARMKRPLEETRVWIEGNSAMVTTIVVFVLATVIIGSGLTHL
ncbi:GAP family protein [Herbiconiux moechotypicola]|uniref:GAP family protein n=1 Tax=Herbiconiux moechotypicola TaxID=637393 RepID=A0ABN3DN83_9MICO|nr:GAP family protein [Herbiconiux moechotypicola]MCS5730364.1 GAP family protein [Herbiconiux moechotypicola]